MKYIEEFRNPELARRLVHAIHQTEGGPWTIMEVCGGQTHGLVRAGIPELLQGKVTLVHGPGCPVCVTPVAFVDRAIRLAVEHDVVLCSFGDMLRVPGSRGSLLQARAQGADVRIVYSPLDAARLAEQLPDRQVVFFAVGFETTAPATALAVQYAAARKLKNFSILCCHVLVRPAMELLLRTPGCSIQAFLAAGHVCTVTGYEGYETLARQYRVPVVVTGFEPLDLLEGIWWACQMLRDGVCEVRNQYRRSVRRQGNQHAWQRALAVYEVCDRTWRGLGPIAASGLRLKEAFRAYDAEAKFELCMDGGKEDPRCRAGEVLQGAIRPDECEAFGTDCTPEHPLGAPMVSAEGACAAYWQYGRRPRVAQS